MCWPGGYVFSLGIGSGLGPPGGPLGPMGPPIGPPGPIGGPPGPGCDEGPIGTLQG